MKRTYVYVDGFNLYYRALRRAKYKWLNLEVLVKELLNPDNDVQQIRYFTAAAQFPDTLPFRRKGKTVTRPVEWD